MRVHLSVYSVCSEFHNPHIAVTGVEVINHRCSRSKRIAHQVQRTQKRKINYLFLEILILYNINIYYIRHELLYPSSVLNGKSKPPTPVNGRQSLNNHQMPAEDRLQADTLDRILFTYWIFPKCISDLAHVNQDWRRSTWVRRWMYG